MSSARRTTATIAAMKLVKISAEEDCGLVLVISDSPRCATKVYALDEKDLFSYRSPDCMA